MAAGRTNAAAAHSSPATSAQANKRPRLCNVRTVARSASRSVSVQGTSLNRYEAMTSVS